MQQASKTHAKDFLLKILKGEELLNRKLDPLTSTLLGRKRLGTVLPAE